MYCYVNKAKVLYLVTNNVKKGFTFSDKMTRDRQDVRIQCVL